MAVKVEVTGGKKLAGAFKVLGDEKMRKMVKAMQTAVTLVASDAKKLVQKGPKTGIKYGKHQASAPGEAPATDTGTLMNSISGDVRMEHGEVIGEVIAKTFYARWLEYGTKKMEPRPFLGRALREKKKRIGELLAESQR